MWKLFIDYWFFIYAYINIVYNKFYGNVLLKYKNSGYDKNLLIESI